LLEELLGSSLVAEEDWDLLPAETRSSILACSDVGRFLAELIRRGLLTEYQADRIEAGKTAGLILNNYRILERLGAGAMGVVFKAENRRMRRPVAIKVLALSHEEDPRILQRFYAEVRAIAQLQHPNIVAAMDAGETRASERDAKLLHYLVMEYVPGQDLDEYVPAHGPLSPATACDIVNQIASALAEAHRHNLVHRDIKPSNIRITPEGQAKLMDFGLTRHTCTRLTEPGTTLGTIDYIAPEQARDAHSVDIRADIYGLGGTLYWCLTGRVPFPANGDIARDLARRLTQPPPSVRTWRPGISEELDSIVKRMMAVDPDKRYPNPQEVMQAVKPFLKSGVGKESGARGQGSGVRTPETASSLTSDPRPTSPAPRRLLIVDDEPGVRKFCGHVLHSADLLCDEAADGLKAVEACKKCAYDLILLDIDMPVMTGQQVLSYLRENPPCSHLKVILFSGRTSGDELAKLMLAGADDYLTKPVSALQLRARVRAALQLKEAQDRSDLLNRHLLAVNNQLERNLTARDCDLVQARNALVMALATLVERRDNDSVAHLFRLQQYARCLAEEAAKSPTFAGQIDRNFIDMLECCAPLHDIGKVGLPDHILYNPGKLTQDEQALMQTHTVIGADTLRQIIKQHGFATAFLQMAADIARHHHERYDGAGYPDRLAGNAIPLAARLVAFGDVYDALRSRRVYKPALSHAAAVRLITEQSPGQFDPALVQVFQNCKDRFEEIFLQWSE
jgi:response regulator RpfG family c-di-GMP phosphodiesterase/serine/threonine protein kinase